jgi:hypothetical protein
MMEEPGGGAIERQRASDVDGDATSAETIPILMVESAHT